MNRTTIAIGIACVLIGACVMFTLAGQGFAQKTTAAGSDFKEIGIAAGRYQGAVNEGNLYVFDTATGAAWGAVTDPENDKAMWKWKPVAGPVPPKTP
jgi:hypothetical protein